MEQENKQGKPPAFQLYASDFYCDTDDWTVTEVGIYIRLLMSQWVNGDLPPEPSRLARIAGCEVRTLQKCFTQTIAKKLCMNAQGRLQNSRLEKTRTELFEYRKKQEESGRKGGLITQQKARETGKQPFKQAFKQKSSPSSSSSSSYKKPLPASLQLGRELFEAIKANNPKSKLHNFQNGQAENQIERWAVDIDLMIRIDKRTEDDISAVIRFATSDSFWKGNILSGCKLRKQFDALYLKMESPKIERGSVL